MRRYFVYLYLFLVSCQGTIDSEESGLLTDLTDNSLKWSWISKNTIEQSQSRLVLQVQFGDLNHIRLHQSMSIYDNKAFCFNDGDVCYVIDLETKRVLNSSALPEKSHHNNAQFLDVFYQEGDKYPLLLLSRGDYPPNQNEFYIVRVVDEGDIISFERLKTIKNTLVEANYGGSWLADTEKNTLYLYTMTIGDYRVKEGNHSCVYSFELPDLLDSTEVTLGYEDVKQYWEFPYFIYQGGTFYNGYLLFNVQSLPSLEGKALECSKNVLLIDSNCGSIDAVLPLNESLETEGISVYNHKLYISFKNGVDTQEKTSIVFKLCEYTFPSSLLITK